MLTAERLRSELYYDPLSGEFVRLSNSRRTDIVGECAGWVDDKGYVNISVGCRTYKAHRLAFLYMTGEWPKEAVDHRNENKGDNRWCNLRQASKAQNEMCKGLRSRNTSGVTGVYWSKAAGKWQAYIVVDGRSKYLGVFTDKKEAIAARKDAEKLFFGEFVPKVA